MTNPYVVRPKADEDLQDQAYYYATEGSFELGHHFLLAADRTRHRGRGTDVFRCPDQFGMCIANLVLSQPAATELIDEVATCQSVVDDRTRPAQ